ncbi:chitin-binding type-2 domain-containing protein [Nephila pilipes]|uniref:Chitin-binding type-2 domain-containing protein n=1 Tax=Nephila pilipes TaxID=299642 RepID=A0A8X6NYH8_NEPPI|nr:chitin-binding type-2 domain-containing protein [Nephila pilipes]
MNILFLSGAFLLCTSVACGINLPNENAIHYDVKQQPESYAIDSKQLASMCPEGKIFDISSNSCIDISKYESEELHRLNSTYIRFHFLPKEEIKQNIFSFIEHIESLANHALQESAPSVYELIDSEYMPIINLLQNDMLPILNKIALPQIKKVYNYSMSACERIVRKLYQSWELSNSTHVNIVSFSDIADDINNDINPILQLAKFLFPKMSQSRSKRSINSGMHVSPITSINAEPILKGIFRTVANAITGGEDPFFNQLVMPIVENMMADPKTMGQLRNVFWIAKNIYEPVAFDLIRNKLQIFGRGRISRQSENRIKVANFEFYKETKPIFAEILTNHLPMILKKSAQNIQIIYWKLDHLKKYSGDLIHEVKFDLFKFFLRHGEYILRDDFNIETFSIMKKNLDVIKPKILRIFINYFSRSPNSWVNFLFSQNSILSSFI